MIEETLATELRESHPTVASMGTYIVDILGRPVSELPRGQISSLLEEIRITVAGTAGGTSVDLARLGAKVIAMGATGRDNVGDFLVSVLLAEGIDPSHLARKEGVQTSATMLPIHPDGSRPAWHVPGANATFVLDDVDWDALATCDAVHLGGLTALPGVDGAPAGEILAYARRHGALTTADCLGVRGDAPAELLAQCLPQVDIFMPNDGEALTATGETDVHAAAKRLHSLGASCVIIKRGPQGCLILDGDGERSVPTSEATVIDTTGCGDAFCAGVIVARCAGWPIDEAARLGCATGTLNVRGLGSDAGARDVDEALAFVGEAVYH